MPNSFRYSLTGDEKNFQTAEITRSCERARKIVAFVPRDLRRSVWDLITKNGRSVREVRHRTGLTERQIIDVIAQRLSDEIEQAVIRDRAERNPNPPAMARRAA